MVGPKLLKKAKRILLFVALNGTINRSQIEKKIKPKIDHPTIYKAIALLEQNGLIKEKPPRRGITRFYDLTESGLIQVITQNVPSSVKKAIINYGGLIPRIFDLWPEIGKAHAEEFAFVRLRSVFSEIALRRNEPILSSLIEDVVQKFWDPSWLSRENNPGSADEWRQIIRSNRKLNDMAIRVIIERAKRSADAFDRSLKLISEIGIKLVSVEGRKEIDELKRTIEEDRGKIDHLAQIIDGLLKQQEAQ